MTRGNAGTHPILVDFWPLNCINCGAPVDLHEAFPCPNRMMTPKELGRYRRAERKAAKSPDADALSGLDAMFEAAVSSGGWSGDPPRGAG